MTEPRYTEAEMKAAAADALEAHENDWRDNFRMLEKAVVGETGLSAMTVAAQARKYRPMYEEAKAKCDALKAEVERLLEVLEEAETARHREWIRARRAERALLAADELAKAIMRSDPWEVIDSALTAYHKSTGADQ